MQLAPHIYDLPTQERVVEAALFLLETNKKIPTQDEVVDALARPDQTGTAKATVNKYWPAFNESLASLRDQTHWLPDSVPDVVSKQLIYVLEWARQEAQKQIQSELHFLEDREAKLESERVAYQEREISLQEELRERSEQLHEQGINVTQLTGRVDRLQQNNQTLQRKLEEKNTSEQKLNDKLASVNETIEEYSNKETEWNTAKEKLNQELAESRQSNAVNTTELDARKRELESAKKVISDLKVQVDQRTHREQSLVNDLKSCRKETDDLKSSLAEVRNDRDSLSLKLTEQAQRFEQSNESHEQLVESQKEALASSREREKSLSLKLEAVTQARSEATIEVARLTAELKQLPILQKHIESLENSIKTESKPSKE